MISRLSLCCLAAAFACIALSAKIPNVAAGRPVSVVPPPVSVIPSPRFINGRPPPAAAQSFPSGYYLANGTFTLRCSHLASTFMCLANDTLTGVISAGGQLQMQGFTATWDPATDSMLWSTGATWTYKGATPALPEADEEADDGFGVPACALQFSICNTTFVSDSCPASPGCPAGGTAAAVNSVINWLENELNAGLKALLTLIGVGAQTILDAAESYAGQACNALSPPSLPVPLYLGSQVKANGDTCANLPIGDANTFFAFNTTLLGHDVCLAVDACTETFALAASGLEVTVFTLPEPPISVKISLDAVGVSLSGNLNVVPASALWSLANGYPGTFSQDAVLGHVDVVGGAVLTVGVSDAISIEVDAAANVLVNYDPLHNGPNSQEHDHGFLIQVTAGGPKITFGPNEVIDLSKSLQLSVVLNWLYLHSDSYQMQLQAQGVLALSELFDSAGAVGTVLNILMPDITFKVTASVYVDQSMWGIYLGLSAQIQLNVFEQALLDIIGANIPSTLSESVGIMVVGNTNATGAKIIATLNDNILFQVNFCSQDSDCVDAGNVCVGVGKLGVCAPFASCTKNSYGRGVGTVPTACPSGTVQDPTGALCYPPCQDGFYMVGPVCWQRCEPYLTDTGLFCQDSVSIYGKGCCCTIFGCCGNCAPDYHDDGCTCRRDRTHAKASYGNGGGTIKVCAPGLEEQAGLCYTPCAAGYYGVGPVCWQTCPAHLPGSGSAAITDAGTYCTSRSDGVMTWTAAKLCPL